MIYKKILIEFILIWKYQEACRKQILFKGEAAKGFLGILYISVKR